VILLLPSPLETQTTDEARPPHQDEEPGLIVTLMRMSLDGSIRTDHLRLRALSFLSSASATADPAVSLGILR
jgi:hypothetical protein